MQFSWLKDSKLESAIKGKNSITTSCNYFSKNFVTLWQKLKPIAKQT